MLVGATRTRRWAICRSPTGSAGPLLDEPGTAGLLGRRPPSRGQALFVCGAPHRRKALLSPEALAAFLPACRAEEFTPLGGASLGGPGDGDRIHASHPCASVVV